MASAFTEQQLALHLDDCLLGARREPQADPRLERSRHGRCVDHHTNPKTSGGARWNYLAAWGYALKQEWGTWQVEGSRPNEAVKAANVKAREFVSQNFQTRAVLDSGARGATNTFVQREIGDVLLAWENEAFLALAESGGENFEIITRASASWPTPGDAG